MSVIGGKVAIFTHQVVLPNGNQVPLQMQEMANRLAIANHPAHNPVPAPIVVDVNTPRMPPPAQTGVSGLANMPIDQIPVYDNMLPGVRPTENRSGRE